MNSEVLKIIEYMKEHNRLCVSPLFCYGDGGEVDLSDLIERLENAQRADSSKMDMCLDALRRIAEACAKPFGKDARTAKAIALKAIEAVEGKDESK